MLLDGSSSFAVLVRPGRATCAHPDTSGPAANKPKPRATVFRVRTRERMRQPGLRIFSRSSSSLLLLRVPKENAVPRARAIEDFEFADAVVQGMLLVVLVRGGAG